MEIKELQERVDAWIRGVRRALLFGTTNMAVLTEEVGGWRASWPAATATSPSRRARQDNLADEMADVLWVLVCLANQTGVDLTAAVEANFAKKTARDRERHKENEKLK